jgi:hypothetical protein
MFTGHSHPSQSQSSISVSTYRIVLFACALASCFPYVKFIYSTESDLQPFALGLGLFFLFLASPILLRQKNSKIFWLILSMLSAPMIFASLKLLIDPNFSVRSAAYYLSVPVFFIFGVESSKAKVWTSKFLFLVATIWLFVGLAQKHLDPELGRSILQTMRTTPNRGVVSLATEPSFYAIQCLMLIIMNWIMSAEKNNGLRRIANLSSLTEILLIFQIVFLAQSFMGTLLLLIFLALRLGAKFPTASLSLGVLMLLFYISYGESVGEYLTTNFPDRRMLWLIGKSLRSSSEIISFDQSAGERISDIVLSFYSMIIEPWLNPGLSSAEWASFAMQHIQDFNYLKFSAFGPRIMSGFGTGFFELGTMGVLIPLAFMMPMLPIIRKNLVVTFTFLIILIAAIQLSLPLVGIILGVLTYRASCATKPLH